MSFIGTLVVWRGSGDIEGPVAAELDFQPFQKRGAWTVAYLSERAGRRRGEAVAHRDLPVYPGSGSPEQSAARGAAWSHAAGLDPDPAALREVFSVGMPTEVFLGLKLFDRQLTGLGLPPSEDSEFDEDS